ncbi:MAG TPA: TonB-dependent receptor [Methylovirgula sp.]|nr:TonB-dependent receptor [Methylovirgula sp.]
MAQAVPAQSEPLPQIVVTPTLVPTPESEVASSITVITSADMQAKQERTVPDALADVPGLNVVQTGGPGGATSVYIRGANANQTKVYIDGVDVSDPSATDGTFDFGQLLTAGIDRIEILRGPQSGLYGSSAIGGVINIITKSGEGPPHVYGSLEGGSFGTFNQTTGISGSVSRFTYSFNFAHWSSTDTDVTPANLIPPGRPLNPDAYDNRTLSLKLGAQISDNFDVGFNTHYIESKLYTTSDDFLGPESLQSINNNQELFTRTFGHLVSFDGRLDQTLDLAYTDYHRSFLDPNPASDDFELYDGDRVKVDYQGNLTLLPGEIATIGAQHELDQFDQPASLSGGAVSAPFSASVTDDAAFAELQSNIGQRFFNSANIRFDHNSQFGNAVTYRVAPAFLIPETGTKLKASLGTGFNAPTLDELYLSIPSFFFFANPNLRPETSIGYDAGFDQNLFGGRASFGATYFHNNIHNLIEIVTNAAFVGTYANVDEATTQGVETYVSVKPWDPLTLRADYTYTRAEDDTSDEPLLRRPKDKASLSAIWQATSKAQLSATLIYVGPWFDNNRDFTNLMPLPVPGYVLVNLAGSYDLGQGVTAFARINNALNWHYQDPLGFERPGLGVFGGLRLAFDAPAGGK